MLPLLFITNKLGLPVLQVVDLTGSRAVMARTWAFGREKLVVPYVENPLFCTPFVKFHSSIT